MSYGVTGLNTSMGLGPIEAIRQASAARKDLDDIDLTRATSVRGQSCRPQALGIRDKLNVSGGAIAVGHPFGMTGARIMTTLIHNLQYHDKQFGVESMCVGGGQGMAMVIERLS